MKKRNRNILLVAAVVLGSAGAFWTLRSSLQSVGRGRIVSVANGPATATGSINRVQPSASATITVSPSKKFSTMGLLEANKILLEIGQQDMASIFQRMLDAGRVEHDLTKQMAIQSIFSGAMRTETPKLDFLEQMRAFLADRSNSNFERGMLLGALGTAATKEALDILIYAATTMSGQDPRQTAIGAIRTVGATGGAGVALSPALESVWRDSSDEELLISVAVAMAEVGAASGVELLLSAALATDGPENVRTRSAIGALEKVFRGSAVPAVAALLADQSTSPANNLAGSILVQIGDATAANALVNWLQRADASVAPNIRRFLIQTRTEALLEAWQAATVPAVLFRSEKNREAISAGLAEYRRNQVRVP